MQGQYGITEYEKELLDRLKKQGFKYVHRDKEGYLHAFKFTSVFENKNDLSIFDDLLLFVKYENENYTEIDNILEYHKIIL